MILANDTLNSARVYFMIRTPVARELRKKFPRPLMLVAPWSRVANSLCRYTSYEDIQTRCYLRVGLSIYIFVSMDYLSR